MTPGKTNNMPRRFVIADIHGCALTFLCLIEEKLRLSEKDTLYLLGDLIDRGPRSREVIEGILSLQQRGFSLRILRGNHEEMLLNACADPGMVSAWLQNGGNATLHSFGVRSPGELSSAMLNLFATLPDHLLLRDFVLVHAGLNFDNDDPFQDREAMIWSRSYDVDPERLGGRRLICGHTPRSLAEIRASLGTSRIMLDNGCVYGPTGGLGNLVALELDTMILHLQENIDR